MNEKCFNPVANFFRCKSFWEQMKRNQESGFRIPVCEIKSNFVCFENFVFIFASLG